MNNDVLNQFIQGIGAISEMWMIAYQSFKRQGLADEDALMHTKAFMAVFIDSFITPASAPGKEAGE